LLEEKEAKRQRQVDFLTHEVERLKDKLAAQERRANAYAAAWKKAEADSKKGSKVH